MKLYYALVRGERLPYAENMRNFRSMLTGYGRDRTSSGLPRHEEKTTVLVGLPNSRAESVRTRKRLLSAGRLGPMRYIYSIVGSISG